jgi:hypothetical protein
VVQSSFRPNPFRIFLFSFSFLLKKNLRMQYCESRRPTNHGHKPEAANGVKLIDISASGVLSRENCAVETDSTTQPSLAGGPHPPFLSPFHLMPPTDPADPVLQAKSLTNRSEEACPVLSRLSMGGCEALLGTHRHAVSAGDGRFKPSVDEWQRRTGRTSRGG